MAWPRSLLLPLLAALTLPACPGETDNSSSSQTDASSSSSASASTSATTSVGETTDTGSSSGTPVTTSDTTPDECNGRPGGDWNACKDGGGTNNALCGFVDNGGQGELTCLSPQSGSFNVCGIRDCVDDCDCWAAPKTGDAIAVCTPVFGDGGKACVLYCLNGQKCPDGMECASGTCYWPDP